MERRQPNPFTERLAYTHLIHAEKDGRPKAELEAKEAEFNKAFSDWIASELSPNALLVEAPENFRRAFVDYFDSRSQGREDEVEKRHKLLALFGDWYIDIATQRQG